MHVAVDGSPLVEQPNSPLSLHLIEWLSALQGAGAGVTLLHPQGELPPIPFQIGTKTIAARAGLWNRLRYEQRDLPLAAAEQRADLLLVGEGGAPLASPCPIVTVSSFRRHGWSRRLPDKLTLAAGQAATRGAGAKLYPGDLRSQAGRMEYAPFIAQAFKKTAEEKGEEYVLCYG
jgi:hypothetical protein